MALKITDLPVDVLSSILASVGKSLGGATDIAKSFSVCKHFLEAGKSNTVYEVVCFRRIGVRSRHDLFQQTDGLLYNSASAGNLSAQFVLAQVILMSSTQLKSFNIKSTRLKYFRNYTSRYSVGTRKSQEGYKVASFMANFTHGRNFRPFLAHWELVKFFLWNCIITSAILMRRHIHAYVEYFTGNRTRGGTDADVFLCSLRSMCCMYTNKLRPLLLPHVGNDHSLLCGIYPSIREWVCNREREMETRDAFLERGAREKVLHDFNRVSRVLPGFAVPKWKK